MEGNRTFRQTGAAVRRAVIPAAGRGTRLRPASWAYPKELVALGARPAIQWVLDEALGAGIDQVAVVVRQGKEAIRRFVDRLAVEEAGYARLRLSWIDQPEPTGLADAIERCRDFARDEPFALLLPDNILPSEEHRLGDLTRLAVETGRHVLGIIEVGAERSGEFGDSGRVEARGVAPRVLELTRLADKLPGRMRVGPGETVRRSCGRIVCQPDLFAELARTRATHGGELDEIPAYQRIVARGEALGWLLAPPLFDVGHPSGLLAASAWLHQRSRRAPEPG